MLLLLVFFAFANFSNSVRAGVRVQQANIAYLGSSTLPGITGNCASQGWDSSPGMSYNPAGNGGAGSFYLTGPAVPNSTECMAEIAIPSVGSTPTLLQGWQYHTLGGATNSLLPAGACGNGCYIGGHIVYNDTLYINVFPYYADPANTNAQFVHSTTLSNSAGQTGPYPIGNSTSLQRALGGWMDQIPVEHQAKLGGAYVTGLGSVSVINNTSFGPSLAVITPGANTLPVWLMRYSGTDDTQGMPWAGNAEVPACTGGGSNRCSFGSQYSGQPLVNATTRIGGMTFIEGSDTVLFVESSGSGPICYHASCQVSNMDTGCSLPAGGYAAAPTKYYFLLFDVNDMAAAKNGTINPWDVAPYAAFSVSTWDTWQSTCSWDWHVNGVQFIRDTPSSSTGKLYVYRARNSNGQVQTPTMYIYNVSGLSSVPDTTPPAAPTGLGVE